MGIVKRDAELFLELSARLLGEGYYVRFRAAGASMQPAIHDGDALILGPVSPAAVRLGDILFYNQHHRAMAHRVTRIRRAGPAIVAFLLRGDAQPACDAAVAPAAVLGRVVSVERRDERWQRLEVLPMTLKTFICHQYRKVLSHIDTLPAGAGATESSRDIL